MNTIVIGFRGASGEAIKEINAEGIIDIRMHLTREGVFYSKNINFLINSFTHKDTWLQDYKDNILEYITNMNFNQDVYNKIYKYLYRYIEYESRYERHEIKPIHYYLNKFNMLYKFFYAFFIKENIELCIFSNLPHEGYDLLIYEIAKALNIKTILFNQCSIPNHYNACFYMEDENDYGDFNFMQKKYKDSQENIIKNSSEDLFYMKNIKYYTPEKIKFKKIINIILCIIKSNIFKSKSSQILKNIIQIFSKYIYGHNYIENLKKNIYQVDYQKKYVYFPLHLQPELTTSNLGKIYCDQLLVLEQLSEFIPSDVLIYIKENPKQTEIMRDSSFFERLNLLKNVRIVPRNENSLKLILNSEFIVTVSGTAGWEALSEKKPVLIFGKSWYQNFEGVFKWSKDLEYNNIARYKINEEKLKKDYNTLLSKIPRVIIDYLYTNAVSDFNKEECKTNLKNILKDIIIEYKNEKLMLN